MNVDPGLRKNQKKKRCGFTLVEMLGVMVVIAILAGITLGAVGAVRRQVAASQAKGEIAALEMAAERYFSDFQSYPAIPSNNPTTSFNPTATTYTGTGQTLFVALFGTNQYTRTPAAKRYLEPKLSMVSSTNQNPYFVDPWGYAYGYYSDGTNAPLIWSTGGQTNASGTNKWITSWPTR